MRDEQRGRDVLAAAAGTRGAVSPMAGARYGTCDIVVWLAGGVVVCSGVTCADSTVRVGDAIVVRDLPVHVLAVRNTARVVRHL